MFVAALFRLREDRAHLCVGGYVGVCVCVCVCVCGCVGAKPLLSLNKGGIKALVREALKDLIKALGRWPPRDRETEKTGHLLLNI